MPEITEKKVFESKDVIIYTDKMKTDAGEEYKQFIIAQLKKAPFMKSENGRNMWNVTYEDRKYINEGSTKGLTEYFNRIKK